MPTNTNIIIHNQDEIRMDHPSTPPLPLPPVLVLSFGNILTKFPEFLLQILPYIADRIVWNSIASSNKMIYKKTKEDLLVVPPWPKNFKLRIPRYYSSADIYNPVWSPDGTQIACIAATSYNSRIVIFDQRRGLLRFRHHDDNVDTSDIGWHSHDASIEVPDLKFSPDGSFLLSCSYGRDGDDGVDLIVKIWDHNTTGYYLQLQQWNISEELDADRNFPNLKIDVSPCSRYVVVLSGRHVLLKDVQNNGKTIKYVLLPANEYGHQILFSDIDGHHSIFISCWDGEDNESNIIKIWCRYDIDDEGDGPNTNASLITILESSEADYFVLSHDKLMLATIYNGSRGGNNNKVMLYSVDSGNKLTTKIKLILKHSFSVRCSPIRFTPDDNYILYTNQNGLASWNITTESEITGKISITYNKNKNICIVDFSPTGSGRRVIVEDHTDGDDKGCYIASFWESSKVQNNCKQQERLK
jgi:hypothetical protein